jgi:ABC-type polysaccharide/polyol phosphate export permease
MWTRLVTDVREMVHEQLEYHELLYRMAARDLTLRYKQTVMGFGWAIFMPLINTIVFSVVFTQVTTLQTPVPYPLFAYAGLWAWNFFASSVRFSVVSLTSNASLVGKVYFPREIFPFTSIAVCLVDFAVAAVPLVALMAWYRVLPGASVLLLPMVLMVHVAFTTAVGLVLSIGNLFYRDVKYLIELALTVWMFATSVVYPLDRLEGKLALLALANPMTVIIDGYRAALFNLPLHNPVSLVVASVASLLFLFGAWLFFHRSEYQFAESL